MSSRHVFLTPICDRMNASNSVLASIVLRGSPFIEALKARRDVHLLEITVRNPDQRLSECLALLEEITHG